MTGSVCSFFIFCFILLLHLYPRKGTEVVEDKDYTVTGIVAPLPPQGDGSWNNPLATVRTWLHLYPRKGTEYDRRYDFR